jgi:hypothetical protein
MITGDPEISGRPAHSTFTSLKVRLTWKPPKCFKAPLARPAEPSGRHDHAGFRYERDNQLEILDVLQNDIKERMETAIAACTTIAPTRKRKLIAIINDEQL